MKSKVYKNFIVNITDYNSVTIVTNTGVDILSYDDVKEFAETTGVLNDLKYELNRAQSTITDFGFKLAKAKANTPIIGTIVEVKVRSIYTIDGELIGNCGTRKQANRVKQLLYNGEITLDTCRLIFGEADLDNDDNVNPSYDDNVNPSYDTKEVDVEDFDWDKIKL